MKKLKGYRVDINKDSTSSYSRNGHEHVRLGNSPKTASLVVDGSILTKREVRKMKPTKKQREELLVKVVIDKNDIKKYEAGTFPKYGKKAKIVEKNYKPNRLNVNNYQKLED